MSIRKQLRERAETKIDSMTDRLIQSSYDILEDDMPITPLELCELAAGTKKSVRAKAITKLADAEEARLLQTLQTEDE